MSNEIKAARYRDDSGCLVFVSSGISGGTVWMTVRQKKPHAGTHRIVSPRLPLRDTPEEAQQDLDAYAQTKGWLPDLLDVLDSIKGTGRTIQ